MKIAFYFIGMVTSSRPDDTGDIKDAFGELTSAVQEVKTLIDNIVDVVNTRTELKQDGT